MTSAAARKAWATRRKLNPLKYKKKQKWKAMSSDPLVHLVRNGKVLTMPQSKVPRGRKHATTIYGSTWEAEQVAKYGPKWFLRKQRQEAKVWTRKRAKQQAERRGGKRRSGWLSGPKKSKRRRKKR